MYFWLGEIHHYPVLTKNYPLDNRSRITWQIRRTPCVIIHLNKSCYLLGLHLLSKVLTKVHFISPQKYSQLIINQLHRRYRSWCHTLFQQCNVRFGVNLFLKVCFGIETYLKDFSWACCHMWGKLPQWKHALYFLIYYILYFIHSGVKYKKKNCNKNENDTIDNKYQIIYF